MSKIAFLIEKSTPSGPLWLSIQPATEGKIQGSFHRVWTNDASSALKFADAESADSFLKYYLQGATCFVAEHSFEAK